MPRQQGPSGRPLRRLGALGLLVAGPAAIAVAGAWLWMSSGRYVQTENAYVKAELIVVSAEVSGPVVEVPVEDNSLVAAGDVLFVIDPQRFEVARARAQAELGAARQKVEALKAHYRTKNAELAAAERDAEFMRTEFDRSQRLREGGTIAEAKLLSDQRLAVQAEHKIAVARQGIIEVLAELGGEVDVPTDAHPDVQRALAELGQAEIDLAATTVRAPSDAIAANVKLQPGEYVEEGDAVLSLVSRRGFWVEANMKETDLTHMAVGQAAELVVDAYPGVTWTGRVASLAPATGAEYALLPPQNASGNWVKVVQRVPVRLEIEPQEGAPELRAGMSVAVSVDTRFERPLPELVTAARAWILPERE
jgi:membrane fusion protein, multidrug efflux system